MIVAAGTTARPDKNAGWMVAAAPAILLLGRCVRRVFAAEPTKYVIPTPTIVTIPKQSTRVADGSVCWMKNADPMTRVSNMRNKTHLPPRI